MHGPIAASSRWGRAPVADQRLHGVPGDLRQGSLPSRVHRRHAPALRIHQQERDAVRGQHPRRRPGTSVHRPSAVAHGAGRPPAGGRPPHAPGGGPPRAPGTRGGSGRSPSPSRAASRAKFSSTAAGASPTARPKLSPFQGGAETPPTRVVKPWGTGSSGEVSSGRSTPPFVLPRLPPQVPPCRGATLTGRVNGGDTPPTPHPPSSTDPSAGLQPDCNLGRSVDADMRLKLDSVGRKLLLGTVLPSIAVASGLLYLLWRAVRAVAEGTVRPDNLEWATGMIQGGAAGLIVLVVLSAAFTLAVVQWVLAARLRQLRGGHAPRRGGRLPGPGAGDRRGRGGGGRRRLQSPALAADGSARGGDRSAPLPGRRAGRAGRSRRP